MNYVKKCILSLTIGAFFVSSSVIAAPEYKYIEKTKEESIAEGITHDFITSFTSDGFRGIHVLKFNLNDQNVDMVPITNSLSVGKGMVISQMVKNKGAVAGVNADFFNYKPFFPLGLSIEKGELITSNSDSSGPTPSILISNDNSLTLGRVEIGMTLKVGEKEIPIGMYNKPNGYGSTGVFTSRWGKKSRGGKQNSQTEILIQDGVVKERRDQGDPFDIPSGGYVVNIKDGMYLPSVGEPCEIVISGINLPDIKFAIGAGSQILKNGQITNSHINIAGRHPRTAIGFNKDTLDCVIVTVDGRSIYHGMDMKEVAELLISLGMTDGFNLDGGGSTTMAIRNIETGNVNVVNYIDSQRAVANGIGLMSKSQVGEPSKIVVDSDLNNIFVGTTRKLNVKIFDEKNNPIKLDLNKLKITSNLEAEINGLNINPKVVGDYELTISYDGINETYKFSGLGSPSVLIIPEDTIAISAGGKYKIKDSIGVDVAGNSAKILASELKLGVVGNVGTIKDGVFTRNKNTNDGAITLSYMGAKNRIVLSSRAKKESINPLVNQIGLKASALPKGAKASLERVKDGKSFLTRLKYDFTGLESDKMAAIKFNNTFIPPNTVELSIFTRNLNNLKLSALISNAGKEESYDFAKNQKVGDFIEWRAKLPAEEGSILKQIEVAEDEGKGGSGYVDFKYVAAVISPDTSKMFPNERSQFFDYLRNDSLDSKDMVVAVSSKDVKDEKLKSLTKSHKIVGVLGKKIDQKNVINEALKVDGNTTIFNFKNTQGGLRASNKKYWNDILEAGKKGNSNVIIIMIDGGSKAELGFINPIEQELFKETMVEMKNLGKRVFVVTNLKEETSNKLIEGVRYININPNFGETYLLNLNRIGDNTMYGIKLVK